MSSGPRSRVEQGVDLAADRAPPEPCRNQYSRTWATFFGTALGRQSHRVTYRPRLFDPWVAQTAKPGVAMRRHWRPARFDFA